MNNPNSIKIMMKYSTPRNRKLKIKLKNHQIKAMKSLKDKLLLKNHPSITCKNIFSPSFKILFPKKYYLSKLKCLINSNVQNNYL